MGKIKMNKKDLRKIIRETIAQSEIKTYYVADSDYFSKNFQINDIARAVRKAGGINIRNESSSDQPEVVVFESTPEMIENITSLTAFFLGTDWVHIQEKDW